MNKLFILFCLIYSFASQAQDSTCTSFPKSVGRVNDFSKVLSSNQRQSLDSLVLVTNSKTDTQITLVTISSLGDYVEVLKFATQLGNCWGVGEKDKDNGIVVLICPALRKTCIATGLGTEKRLSDQKCENLVNTIIIPNCKQNNYHQAFYQTLIQLQQLLK